MPNLAAGKAVQAYRKRLGLSVEDAAARWGMPPRTLQEIETRGARETYAGLLLELVPK